MANYPVEILNKTEAYKVNFEKWESGSLQYGALKGDVAEALIELTQKFKNNLQHIRENEDSVKEQVFASSAQIRKKAQQTIDEVREITGLAKLRR